MSGRRPTVQVLFPNRLAPKEKWRLLSGLEKFVNLGSTQQDFAKYATQWPTFSPIAIRKGGPTGEPMGLTPDMHVLALKYRDYLRHVWVSDPKVDAIGLADILLGLKTQEARDPSDPAPAKFDQRTSLGSQIKSFAPHGSDQFLASPTVTASWRFGDFCYCPLTDFQRAFYLLFRESWRARICAHCRAYFIADKPPKRYCSTACYGEAKRGRSLEWWRRKGAARRRKLSTERNKERKGGSKDGAIS